MLLGEGVPALHRSLAGLVAGVLEVQLVTKDVVRHRPLGFAGAQRLPGALLRWVPSPVDVLQLSGGGVSAEPVEHATGTDRGELLAVADSDELRPGVLHQPGEGVEAVVVGHSRLVEEDRRGAVDLDAPGARARHERVEGECSPGERWAVGTETLRGAAGYRDPEDRPAGVLLGTSGSVDHDSLPGAGGADEHGEPLGAGDRLQRMVLLGAEGCGDPLGDLPHRALTRALAGVPACGLGELGYAPLDRLLLCANSERRHPSALQGEDAPVADHFPGDPERHVRRHLPGGLLKRDRSQLTRVEDRVMLGQVRLDAALH